ncbi:hypothetical protein EX30DRAFT_398779 [Ascodesmis nigricans]|uniref:Uncharacterized protein n=1 Tax=Ascodesmis nigricans TaxID=341454 RepID=A0A4S2MJG3_9PEZI|nr:hypothetical protein EX30DRAFT_398779 [Ascodesmis nigricans]
MSCTLPPSTTPDIVYLYRCLTCHSPFHISSPTTLHLLSTTPGTLTRTPIHPRFCSQACMSLHPPPSSPSSLTSPVDTPEMHIPHKNKWYKAWICWACGEVGTLVNETPEGACGRCGLRPGGESVWGWERGGRFAEVGFGEWEKWMVEDVGEMEGEEGGKK